MIKNCDEIISRMNAATGTRTQMELAAILGIRQSSISDAKRRGTIPAEWFLKLYRTHGLNPDWLSDGVEPVYLKPGVERSSKSSSMIESVTAGGKSPSKGRIVNVSSMMGASTESGQWEASFIEQLSIPESFYSASLLVLEMDGSNMEPAIRKGAYVGIDTDQKRVVSGEIYGLTSPYEGLSLKRVFFDMDRNLYLLKNENPAHPDQTLSVDQISKQIVGRLVWVLQRV